MKHCWTILIGLTTASSIHSQTILEGAPGTSANIVTLGLVDERPPALQGIELLPIDSVGRTTSTSLLPDRAQRVDDLPTANRLLLPGLRGSLYKYRRLIDSSETRFGLMRIQGGHAESVFELEGWGLGHAADPMPGKLAISSDGTALLAATTLGAGGDLWDVNMVAGTVVLRSAVVAPRSYKNNGLALMADWGFALSTQGPQRYQRSSGARVENVQMPTDYDWYGADVVFSRDESTVAFLAGDSADQAHVFLCRRSGPIEQVTSTPDRIAGAGFLPEEAHGPTMALSTDGSRVAWMTRNDYSREVWVGQTQAASVQVTSDERFDDTLNDAGVISFFDPDSLVVLVGEGADVGEGDLYRIDLDPAPLVTNLTGTSGILLPPQDYGTIAAADGVFQLPGDAGWLLLDSRENDDTPFPLPGRLLRAEADGVLRTLLENVETVERVELTGGYVAAIVERTLGADVPGVTSRSVVQVSLAGDEVVRLLVPIGSQITRALGSRSHDRLTLVASHPAGEWLGQILVPSSSGLVVSNLFLRYGPTMSRDAAGNVYATLIAGPVNAFFAWTDQGPIVLRQTPGFVLPGE